jgi:hypothetical protein
MQDISIVYISVGSWLGLGVFVYFIFLRLQVAERETLLPEEDGKQAIYESIGKGAMNRASPVRKPFARITLYDTFLAACLKSQRKPVLYREITSVSIKEHSGQEWLYIEATTDSGDLAILFNSKDQQSLMDQIELRRRVA